MLFLTRIALWKYRDQLPGFELPKPIAGQRSPTGAEERRSGLWNVIRVVESLHHWDYSRMMGLTGQSLPSVRLCVQFAGFCEDVGETVGEAIEARARSALW
jgi:hypothetical protein